MADASGHQDRLSPFWNWRNVQRGGLGQTRLEFLHEAWLFARGADYDNHEGVRFWTRSRLPLGLRFKFRCRKIQHMGPRIDTHGSRTLRRDEASPAQDTKPEARAKPSVK